MKPNLIAFDDSELSNWLLDLIADQSESFLSALAEVVLTADAEDYNVIRPALVELKRRYFDRNPSAVPELSLLLSRTGCGTYVA